MNPQTRCTRRQGLLITFGGLIAAALLHLSTGVAHADSAADYDMQDRMEKAGMWVPLHTAHETGDAVCGYLHVDPSEQGINHVLATYEHNSFSSFQAGVIVGAAIAVYCPDMSDVLNSWLVHGGNAPLHGYYST